MARSRPSLLKPSYWLRSRSINKGLLGDDRLWRMVFFVIYGRRLMRRVLGSEPETVAVEKLAPGQFVSIEAIDPRTLESPRRRRKARRTTS